MDYSEILDRKRHVSINYGIDTPFMIDSAFDFQKHVVNHAVKKGRCAAFLDTGLGKTLIELSIAHSYVLHTNKPVLIITPLAVAFQFLKEAEKFGIPDVFYSKDGAYGNAKIVVCNYERLSKFNPNDFECVVLDESSILKNFDGAIKTQITAFLRKVKYRYLFTATPSPNDYIELGTSSEALGYMGYMDMLSRFFKNNDNTSKITRVAEARQGSEWYLKPHAERDFWRWVSSWSVSMRRPSDLGFDDSRHVLPNLNEFDHVVANEGTIVRNGQALLFNVPAQNFREISQEVKQTVKQRCEKAFALASDKDTSVYWVSRNEEGDLLEQIDAASVQIHGSMSVEEKEDILVSFSEGSIKKLITKPTITGFGLNWQLCNHTVYFPTFSYEQYYQAIRRFYRFGQTKDVTVDRVFSDGQTKVLRSMSAKKDKADAMFDQLVKEMNQQFTITTKEFDKQIILPKFLR